MELTEANMSSKDKLLPVDELVRVDPVWKKVIENEERTPHIKLIHFFGRFTEARVFVGDLLALHSINKEALLDNMMKGIPELLGDPRILKANADKNPKELIAFLTTEIRKNNTKQVDKYRLWILNQALVIYCTIFDVFLENVLEAILRQNVKILHGVTASKNFDLKKIIDLGSVEAIVDEVRAKVIKDFSHESIRWRFDFLESKLGIKTVEVFSWQDQQPEFKEMLAGLDLQQLEIIYNKRHSIVHRDDSPITTEAELDLITEFFIQLSYNVMFQAMKTHKVPLDLVLIFSRGSFYERFKKEQSE